MDSRVFEFGAVLYLAIIFPDTLLPMSTYAFTRGLAAFIFSPVVGQYIDVADRLQCVRLSIVVQRTVVAASCAMFLLLTRQVLTGESSKQGTLALLTVLSCFGKLASIMNLASVEKDWVVVVAGNDRDFLGQLNVQMRRIDLLCKLLSPLFIGLIDGISTDVAIAVNLTMNVASFVVEYFAIARVYYNVPELRQAKTQRRQPRQLDDGTLAPTRGRDFSINHNIAHLRPILAQLFWDFVT